MSAIQFFFLFCPHPRLHQPVEDDVDDVSIESALKALGTDWMNSAGARAQGASSSTAGVSSGPSASSSQQPQPHQDGQGMKSNGGSDVVEPVVVERKKKKKKKKRMAEIGEPAPSASSGLDESGSKSKKSPALSVL